MSTPKNPDPAMSFALRGIVFPPRPEAIARILRETAKPHPDLRAIAQFIGGDVTLASSLLKMVNSPYYGLPRKVASVEEALILVGIKRTLTMVMALSLSQSFKPIHGLETFWEDTARVASYALILANELSLDGDLAYLMGLFHDAGILLMIQQYTDYLEVHRTGSECLDQTLVEIENRHYRTDHARVGSLFARYWYLPEAVVNAIHDHHDIEAFRSHRDIEASNLIAVTLIAEEIDAKLSYRPNLDWTRMGNAALEHLMIGAEEFDTLATAIITRFQANTDF